jgi:hypothetical protein
MTVPADFDTAVRVLRDARFPAALFTVDNARPAYRAWVKLVHPDRAPHGRVAEATEAFVRLGALWSAWRHATSATVTGRQGEYRVSGPAGADEIAEYLEAAADGGPVLLKVARRPRDNDLLEREAEALQRLQRSVPPRHRAYLPALREAFTYREGGTGIDRAVNVLDRLGGFVSLASVRVARPDGLDPRDVGWMWRRLLVALGAAHRAGLVHGGVLPGHVLIEPELHGLVLVNWCYSAGLGEPVPALVAGYQDWYAPEIRAGAAATPSSDIYLATRCMVTVLGRRASNRLGQFARGCLGPKPNQRPDDAWRLLAELDDVLRRSYGPRTFRPFAVPATVPAWPQQGR